MSDPVQQRTAVGGLLSGVDQNLQQPFGGREVDARPGSVRRALIVLGTGLLVLVVAVAVLLLR